MESHDRELEARFRTMKTDAFPIASSEKQLCSVSQSQTGDARGTQVRAFQTQPPSTSCVNGGAKRAASTRRDCSLEQTRAAAARVPPRRASSGRVREARVRGASARPPRPPAPASPASPYSLPGSFCAIFFPCSYLDGKMFCSVHFWKD